MRSNLLLFCIEFAGTGWGQERVQLKFDTSEADAVLAILDKEAAAQSLTDQDWKRLFTSTPYVRLKKREAAFHREFTDDEFKSFVGTLLSKRAQLRATLDKWKSAELNAAGRRALHYLPPEARIHASIYPVIKPKTNSFVWDTASDPAIFLYLDPSVSSRQFENTVAHELHHIGLASLDNEYEQAVKALSPNAREVAKWMSALGEGMAMLAAAGSPDSDPVADFPESQQQCWAEESKGFDNQLNQINQFFLDIIHDDYRNLEAADHVAYTFFGFRGPWYVVGYRMAVTIEKQFGHQALVESYRDPREFVRLYNQAAAAAHNASAGEKLPLFSAEVISAVGLKP
jgi:hypothetical protein